MTCYDCIHIYSCKYDRFFGVDDVENKCNYFKNKADFVEVVRCTECVYCENMKCTELKDNSGHPLDVAIFDYCSQGVRK